MSELEARRSQHLIETEELAERLAAGDTFLRVVDMRGFVKTQAIREGVQEAAYLGAREEYNKSHLSGAIYLDWTRDIVDEREPTAAQLAAPQQMAERMGQAGIGDAHEIVVYDAHPAAQFATRCWWAMRCYGHDRVRVLNGGWRKWTAENRPVTAEIPHFSPAIFTPHLVPEWRADAERVLRFIKNPDALLLDARDEAQFTGQIRRGSRGGHIPGARHMPREAFFAPDGTFRPDAEIAAIVHKAGAVPEKQIVAYCNGGVAATSALFALSLLGFQRLTNYDGSWNEWSERPDLPVENATD